MNVGIPMSNRQLTASRVIPLKRQLNCIRFGLRGMGKMTRVDLTLRPATNSPACIGVGFVAADIVEGSSEEFVAAGGSCGTSWLSWLARMEELPGSASGNGLGCWGCTKGIQCPGRAGHIPFEGKGGSDSDRHPAVCPRRERQEKFTLLARFPECGGWLPRYRASTLSQANDVTEFSGRAEGDSRWQPISPAALRSAAWAKEEVPCYF